MGARATTCTVGEVDRFVRQKPPEPRYPREHLVVMAHAEYPKQDDNRYAPVSGERGAIHAGAQIYLGPSHQDAFAGTTISNASAVHVRGWG
jgi:hypothetical protein